MEMGFLEVCPEPRRHPHHKGFHWVVYISFYSSSNGFCFYKLLIFAKCSFLGSSAKPGRVVGPLPPYENGNLIKQAYDPRTLVRSAVIPTQVVHPAYCHRRNSAVNLERTIELERDLASKAKQVHLPLCGVPAKLAPEIAINIDTNPFYMTRAGVTKMDNIDDRIALNPSLMQARAQYGANVAAHRKVGAVQYGMSSMY